MRYAIPQANRFELAQNIGLFLVGKGLNTWSAWKGHLTKKEQMESFGFYMGKGLIVVDGEQDQITMSKKVCFGLDYDDVFYASARTGWLSFDGNRKAPIEALNLYSSLNQFSEVAA